MKDFNKNNHLKGLHKRDTCDEKRRNYPDVVSKWQIKLRSPVCRMKNKISLLLFLVLITFAICSAAERSEKTEKTSLSEEASFSRVARSADADAGGKKNKSLKKKKRKHQKSKKGAKKAIKSEKNKRKAQKNKRKAKKNKRKTKKNKRKTQKNKKNVNKRKRKAKKHKRNKKNQSNEKNQSIKKNKERTQEGKNWPLDGHCVECAASGMNRWRTVVANFAKQKSRIEKQSEIAAKKGAKNGVFAPIALKLVAVGGGNKSNLTCSGSADSDGAKQLTNLTQTLFACEAKLNQSCAAVDVNMTHVNQCAMDLELFENRTKECLALSKSDTAIQACYCWINETYRALDNKIKSCKIAESTNVTKGLKACKDAFSTCRQAEDDAVDAIAACSVSEETLLARAAALGANVNMTSACATQVAGITGSSGQVPRIRSGRAAASNCSEFITLVDKCRFISVSPRFNKISYFHISGDHPSRIPS